MSNCTGWHSALILLVASSLAAPTASALELTSTAAGFAGTLTTNCQSDANNLEIEILYNSYLSCQRHGIAEFSFAGTGLSSVSGAIVTLFDAGVGNMEGFSFAVDLYGYAGDGQVTSSDFTVGSYFRTATWSRYGDPQGQFAFDVTDFVNAQLALGTEIIGVNLRAPLETTNCCTTTFLFFDGALGDHPPTLSLEPVPLPPGAWLFGSALGLMGWCRRRPGRPVLAG